MPHGLVYLRTRVQALRVGNLAPRPVLVAFRVCRFRVISQLTLLLPRFPCLLDAVWDSLSVIIGRINPFFTMLVFWGVSDHNQYRLQTELREACDPDSFVVPLPC